MSLSECFDILIYFIRIFFFLFTKNKVNVIGKPGSLVQVLFSLYQ